MQETKIKRILVAMFFSTFALTAYSQRADSVDQKKMEAPKFKGEFIKYEILTNNEVNVKDPKLVEANIMNIKGVDQCHYSLADQKIVVIARKEGDFVKIEQIKSLLVQFNVEINKYSESIY
jgi:hypothetical protein